MLRGSFPPDKTEFLWYFFFFFLSIWINGALLFLQRAVMTAFRLNIKAFSDLYHWAVGLDGGPTGLFKVATTKWTRWYSETSCASYFIMNNAKFGLNVKAAESIMMSDTLYLILIILWECKRNYRPCIQGLLQKERSIFKNIVVNSLLSAVKASVPA